MDSIYYMVSLAFYLNSSFSIFCKAGLLATNLTGHLSSHICARYSPTSTIFNSLLFIPNFLIFSCIPYPYFIESKPSSIERHTMFCATNIANIILQCYPNFRDVKIFFNVSLNTHPIIPVSTVIVGQILFLLIFK